MKRNYIAFLLLLWMISVIYSCKKNFPQDIDAFNLDMNFTIDYYAPVLGRNTLYASNFNHASSSLPLSFRISAVRTFEGKPAPELLKLFPVSAWKERYTGEESTLAEIQAKRDTVLKPLWEIGQHSGSFTMWQAANSSILKVYPDSCYFFDVEVSSSGGRRYFRDLKLVPHLEQPFSSDIIGMSLLGEETKTYLTRGKVQVWFNKVGDGSTITFKMLNPDLTAIPLNKFASTDWDLLVHGFNRRFAADFSSVTYDVAYPIPLVGSIDTKYVRAGSGNALVKFTYDLIGLNGYREPYGMQIPFRIYEKGDWEVIIYFSQEAPLFTND